MKIWEDNATALRYLLEYGNIREFKKWAPVRKCMVVAEQIARIERLEMPNADVKDDTLLHQLYHLKRLEDATGLTLAAFDNVVEFGGGYGAMCRVVRSLGFKGDYTIIDLPEVHALQSYYLKDLEVYLSSDAIISPKTLVLGMWSLSETDIETREKFRHLLLAHTVWLAIANSFEGIDNLKYFEGKVISIGHISNSSYILKENR